MSNGGDTNYDMTDAYGWMPEPLKSVFSIELSVLELEVIASLAEEVKDKATFEVDRALNYSSAWRSLTSKRLVSIDPFRLTEKGKLVLELVRMDANDALQEAFRVVRAAPIDPGMQWSAMSARTASTTAAANIQGGIQSLPPVSIATNIKPVTAVTKSINIPGRPSLTFNSTPRAKPNDSSSD